MVAYVPDASVGSFVLATALALVLGAAIGAERQWRQRTAGLRTNALVSLGAALFVGVAVRIPGPPGYDPTRIDAYIISGMGFLGAGIILRDGVNIRGINTAATMWCSAAVGVLAGNHFYLEALAATAFVIIGNIFLRPVAHVLDRRPAPAGASEDVRAFRFRVVCKAQEEARVRILLAQALSAPGLRLRALSSEDIDGRETVEVQADIERTGHDDVSMEELVSRLSLEPAVTAVSWTVLEEGI
ncbi:MAG: MgtC/SapB family protein [Firmicutes bacterium]|nr:MgtC/SapB family protein [Bacillota bacterium]